MLRRVIGRLSHALKSLRMTDIFPAASEAVAQSNTTKRELEDAADHDDAASKKQRTEGKPMQGRPDRKRKVAMLLSYSGAGYYGMQINTGYDTIESELCKALVAAGLIPQEHADNMSKMSFQRAARTDKGVSALGQVVSLKMTLDRDNVVEEINKHLPDQIRVMGIIRTTKSFNSKNFCGGRTYVYMLPTYAFAPVEKFIDEEYRIPDETIKRVNEVLVNFKGTHNFHNYTSGIKPDDPSAKRYMLGLECGRPFVRDNLEFVKIRVQGQSFMLHHIRKMIGVTISIVRGYAGEDLLAKTWGTEKVDIPKAPGLGLMLDTLHYDGYNKKFGSDGIHKELEWSDYREKIDEFAEKYIFNNIVKTEKEERSMFNWLTTLPHHSFDVRQEGTSLLFKAYRNVLAQEGAVNDAGSTECAEKELADVSETTAIKSESDQNNGDQTTTISEQDAQTEDKMLKHDVS